MNELIYTFIIMAATIGGPNGYEITEVIEKVEDVNLSECSFRAGMAGQMMFQSFPVDQINVISQWQLDLSAQSQDYTMLVEVGTQNDALLVGCLIEKDPQA